MSLLTDAERKTLREAETVLASLQRRVCPENAKLMAECAENDLVELRIIIDQNEGKGEA